MRPPFRPLALLLALGLLAGCGGEEPAREAPQAADAPAPAAPAEASGWRLEQATLSLGPPDRRLLSLSCRAGTRDLLVNLPGFKPIGSEERLSFGAGGTAVALVADTRGDSKRSGVTATGPVPAELAAILADPAGVSVSYGADTSGPHPPVPAPVARRFVAGCD